MDQRRFPSVLRQGMQNEIAAMTGHSLKGVSEILDRHYLSRDNALGENAMRKLEMGTKTGKRQENGRGD